MNVEELLRRRAFDWQVLRDMACPTFAVEAYRNVSDLEARRAPVSVDDARDAVCYRFTFKIPTLVGPGRFTPATEIGADTAVADYPRTAPRTWILSQVPWSPHFLKGAPVCIGPTFWTPRAGHVLLGELVEHIARLLNWDEAGRGPGYRGWNGAAIDYHKEHYGTAPLNPNIVYPRLPAWVDGGGEDQGLEMEILSGRGGSSGLGFEIRR